MLTLPAVGLMLSASTLIAPVPDIYQPFLQDNPPEIVEERPEQRIGDVIVREFWFIPREFPGTGDHYEVHSVLARPAEPGPHPAILFCHGGGGYTQRERTCIIGWAKKGYVCIGQDQPGFCNLSQSLTRGPDKPILSSISATPDATSSPLFDGVVAVLRSLSILRNHPDVDPERIGVFGGSWGGYMTTMAAALAGEKLSAAFSVYGAGYYDLATAWTLRLRDMPEDERERWLAAFDPGRLATNIRADYMITQASNDWYFWPPAIEATLDNMPAEGPSAEKNWLFSPNDYHAIRYPGGTGSPRVDHREHRTWMELRYMNWKLKDEGAPFPTAEAIGEPVREGDSLRVRFRVDHELPLTSAEVYWSGGEMPWRMRWWEAVEATEVEDGVYEALIPVRHADKRLDWLGMVSDEEDATVSTRIQRRQPTEVGFEEDAHPVEVTLDDLQTLIADGRWRWAAGTSRGGEGYGYGLEEAAAREEGDRGLRITGKYIVAAWGVRAADIEAAGAEGVRLWVRSAGEEPVDSFRVGLTVEVDGGEHHFFYAKSVDEMQGATALGPDWQLLELSWSDFVCERAPVKLLSDGLGELRLSVEEKGETVHVDGVEFVGG